MKNTILALLLVIGMFAFAAPAYANPCIAAAACQGNGCDTVDDGCGGVFEIGAAADQPVLAALWAELKLAIERIVSTERK